MTSRLLLLASALLTSAAYATTVEPDVAIVSAPPATEGLSRVQVVAGDDTVLAALRSGDAAAARAVSPAGTASVRSIAAIAPAGSRTVIAVDQSGSFRAHWKDAFTLARALGDATPAGVSVEVLLFGATLESAGVAQDAASLQPVLAKAEAAGATQGYTRLRNFIREATTRAEAGAPISGGALRQVVVFTDAGEESTAYPVADVVALARQNGVALHIVAWQPRGATAAKRLDEVKQMAEQTGGLFVQVDDPKDAAAAMARIATAPTRAFKVELGWCGAPSDKGDRLDSTVEIEVWSAGQRVATTGAAPFRQHAAGPALQPCTPAPPQPVADAPPEEPKKKGWPWWWWIVPASLLPLLLLLLLLLLRRRPEPAPVAAQPVVAPPPPPPPVVPSPPVTTAGSAFPPVLPGDDPLERLPEIVLEKLRGPPELPARVRLHKRSLRVGAGADADIRLDVAQISTSHATLQLYPNGNLYVKDEGSTNGTWVGEQKVPGQDRLKVTEGQVISFSRQVAYRVVRPGAAPQAAPPPEPTPAPPPKNRTIFAPIASPIPGGDAPSPNDPPGGGDGSKGEP